MTPAAPRSRFCRRPQAAAEGRPPEQGADEAARLHAMAESCAASIGALEERMGQSLLTLALDIAQQVIRNTLAEQPESVVHAVREVLHINPSAGESAAVGQSAGHRTHPPAPGRRTEEGHWRVLADESLARGGCRAETPYGDIDATLQTRWRRVAASLGRNTSWEEPARETEATPRRPAAVPVIDRWQTQLEIGRAERQRQAPAGPPPAWAMPCWARAGRRRPSLDGLGPLTGAELAPLSAVGPTDQPAVARAHRHGAGHRRARAINGLLTVGRGQRMGLFAGSGVGKSVLLGMMARTPRPTSSSSA